MFSIFDTVITPVPQLYAEMIPSKEFVGSTALTTTTEFPGMYANCFSTVTVTDPPITGSRRNAEVVAVLNLSAYPVGPVTPVVPVVPVGPSRPFKFTL